MNDTLKQAALALMPIVGEGFDATDLPTRLQAAATTLQQLDVALSALVPLCEAARACGVDVTMRHIVKDMRIDETDYLVMVRLRHAHSGAPGTEQCYPLTPNAGKDPHGMGGQAPIRATP